MQLNVIVSNFDLCRSVNSRIEEIYIAFCDLELNF